MSQSALATPKIFEDLTLAVVMAFSTWVASSQNPVVASCWILSRQRFQKSSGINYLGVACLTYHF